jgi:hypothetical protein
MILIDDTCYTWNQSIIHAVHSIVETCMSRLLIIDTVTAHIIYILTCSLLIMHIPHDIDLSWSLPWPRSLMHACCLVKYYRFIILIQFIWWMWPGYRLIIEHLCMLSINGYPLHIINRCMSSIYGASCSYYPMYATYVLDKYCIHCILGIVHKYLRIIIDQLMHIIYEYVCYASLLLIYNAWSSYYMYDN